MAQKPMLRARNDKFSVLWNKYGNHYFKNNIKFYMQITENSSKQFNLKHYQLKYFKRCLFQTNYVGVHVRSLCLFS